MWRSAWVIGFALACSDSGEPASELDAAARDAAATRDATASFDAAPPPAVPDAAHDGATEEAPDAAIEIDFDPAAIGEACEADGDCAGGRCASALTRFRGTSAAAPGGYCTADCALDTQCGRGNACASTRPSVPGHCSRTCEQSADCREGYRCVPLPPSDEPLQSRLATCEPTPETDLLEDGIVGAGCAGDADCGDGRCLLEEMITRTPYPGGLCTGRCVDDSDCGEGGVCTTGFLGAIGACALGCDDDDGCAREGYRCRVVEGIGRCAPGPEPLPDHTAGNACESDDDCGGGADSCSSEVAGNAAPGGYCGGRCAIDADCGADGKCINGIMVLTLPSGSCMASCARAEDCRDDYECRSISGIPGSDGVCAPIP